MNASRSAEGQGDSFHARMLRWAGLSGIAIAIGYVAISIGFALSGQPLPRNAAAWVSYLDGKEPIWWMIIWLSIITDILYLPVALGLHDAMKGSMRGAMLVSAALFSLFVLLELSITWSKYPALLELVRRHRDAVDTDARQALLAAIEAVSTEFQTPVTAFYMILIPSLAVIIASVAMLRTRAFGRVTAIIGMVSGLCNAISSLGRYLYEPLEKLVLPGSFLALFWFLGVGIRLIRNGRAASDHDERSPARVSRQDRTSVR